jgi:hypothetical protein
MDNNHIQAKLALLESAYGKFDLVSNLISPHLLLTGKPRRIKEWLVQNLQIKESDINSNTLRSWLYRFRKKHFRDTISLDKSQWQTFNPSIVNSETNPNDIIIKKVTIP